MSRLAAFVITYRRPETAVATVSRLLEQSRSPEHVLVVDNEGSTRTAASVRDLDDPRLAYLAMPGNAGPAGAAGQAMARLRAEGYDWLLWCDDDDPPKTPDTVERLCSLIEPPGAPDVAGVSAVGARWDWRRGTTVRLSDDELSAPTEVDVAGGGQSLIVRAELLVDKRLPDPRLFFGFEEFDFCLRLRRDGYRLLVDGELMREYRRLAGRLGAEIRPRPGRRYPPETLWRRYYATRNYIYLMRRTFGRHDLAYREAVKSLIRCMASWSAGLSYGRRFTELQLLALRDGFTGRLGRTIEPSGGPAGGGRE